METLITIEKLPDGEKRRVKWLRQSAYQAALDAVHGENLHLRKLVENSRAIEPLMGEAFDGILSVAHTELTRAREQKKAALAQVERLNDELGIARNDYQRTIELNQILTRQRDNTIKANDTLRIERAAQAENISVWREQCTAVQKECEHWKARVNLREGTIRDLHAERDAARGVHPDTALRKRYDDLSNNYAKANNELNSVQNNFRQLEKMNATQLGIITELRSNLAASRGARNASEDALIAARDKVGELTQRLDEASNPLYAKAVDSMRVLGYQWDGAEWVGDAGSAINRLIAERDAAVAKLNVIRGAVNDV